MLRQGTVCGADYSLFDVARGRTYAALAGWIQNLTPCFHAKNLSVRFTPIIQRSSERGSQHVSEIVLMGGFM